MKMSRILTALMLLGLFAFTTGMSSCKSSLISGVGFTVEPDLETVKVKLNFDKSLQTDLGGTFQVKDYGTLEVEPWTPESPFNVGFRLNTHILEDQDYVKLDRTDTLPSGQPIPIMNLNRKMAAVSLKNEINKNFDIYAYVDVADGGRQWLGLALTLKFINNKYFPAGLSVSKQFLKDKQGHYQMVGALFGPKVDDNGNLLVPGGIAFFANVKSLISGGARSGKDKGTKMVLFQGFEAPYYEKHPKAALELQRAFKELIEGNSYGRRLM